MKKIRWIMLSTAVVTAVVAAMATNSRPACSSLPQYWEYNGNFYPAGIEGYDYVCQFDHYGKTCTYYFDEASGTYKPCKYGKILWIR
jgi:hypothetical protein